jgi:hypothetical protein
MRYAVLSLLLALAACGVPNGPPLVSAQFPPGTGVVNSQSIPQSINSLPPGAANYSTAPGGVQPSYATLGFRL